MSNTDNHKKAINITASCYKNRGMLTKIYYQILEDHPSAIINAFERLSIVEPSLPVCKDCLMVVDELGIAGACIKCDPRGMG